LLEHAFGPAITLQHAVVPLDGSAPAEAALRVVNGLAPDVVREVTLVRVIGAAEEAPDAGRYLEEVAGRLTHEHLACWRRVEQGDPAAALIYAPNTSARFLGSLRTWWFAWWRSSEECR
jgi:hypothetical protein